MKISFGFASPLAIFLVTGHVANAHHPYRQLQNFPTANNQGLFRPQFAPNGLQGQPAPGGVPAQGNGLGQGSVPMNGQEANGQGANNQAMGAGARESDGTGPNDVVEEAETGAPAPATADTNVPTTPVVTAPTGDIAPGQPTIMVIVPDFLASGSGWSSYTGDVGETKTPSSEKPKDEEPLTTSVAAKRATAFRALTAVVTFAVVLGLSGFANVAN